METILLVVVLLALFGLAFFIVQLNQKLVAPKDDSESMRLMLQTIENLRKEVQQSGGENRKELQSRLDATLELLNKQFNQLNKSVDLKISENTKVLGERLDNAAKVIAATNKEMGKISEISGAVENLNNFLRHSKRRGNLGEEGLKEMLGEVLPADKWKLQYAFRGGEVVDAIIDTNNGIIPIDSKFPLENFERLQLAGNKTDEESARKEFGKDVKKHIDAIAKKYIRPDEGTTDFAVMYVPAESVHYEAAIASDELAKYARERRVHLVSPASLFYFLRVILIAFQSQRFEENAKRVLGLIAGVKTESEKFGATLELTAKHVTNAKAQMDNAVAGYQKLETRIDRISEESVGEISTEPRAGQLL